MWGAGESSQSRLIFYARDPGLGNSARADLLLIPHASRVGRIALEGLRWVILPRPRAVMLLPFRASRIILRHLQVQLKNPRSRCFLSFRPRDISVTGYLLPLEKEVRFITPPIFMERTESARTLSVLPSARKRSTSGAALRSR